MFKIAELKNAEETVITSLNTIEHCKYQDGKTIRESFETLEFEIIGKIGTEEYNLSFELNCRLEELLKLPNCEKVDFSPYLLDGETWFNKTGLKSMEPIMDIKITRYLNTKFVLFLTFYTEGRVREEEDYSGIIEITFDLNQYLKK